MAAQPTRCSAMELVNDPVPASTKTHTSFAACTRVRSAGEKPLAAAALASVLVAPVKSTFHPTPCGERASERASVDAQADSSEHARLAIN